MGCSLGVVPFAAEERSQQVHADTPGGSVFRIEAGGGQPRSVPAHAWIEGLAFRTANFSRVLIAFVGSDRFSRCSGISIPIAKIRRLASPVRGVAQEWQTMLRAQASKPLTIRGDLATRRSKGVDGNGLRRNSEASLFR